MAIAFYLLIVVSTLAHIYSAFVEPLMPCTGLDLNFWLKLDRKRHLLHCSILRPILQISIWINGIKSKIDYVGKFLFIAFQARCVYTVYQGFMLPVNCLGLWPGWETTVPTHVALMSRIPGEIHKISHSKASLNIIKIVEELILRKYKL